eukprot:8879054-Pyramimonas_sp.AAC.1
MALRAPRARGALRALRALMAHAAFLGALRAPMTQLYHRTLLIAPGAFGALRALRLFGRLGPL